MDTNNLKHQLLEKKAQLHKQLESLSSQDPFENDERLSDTAAVDSEARSEENHDRVSSLLSETRESIAEIEIVLDKIEKGTYGTCSNCGQPIGDSRLDVFPMAEYCLSCEKKLEKK